MKNIIIYNYILTTFFILMSMSYFYINYQTLNKNILFLIDPNSLQKFILFFIFVKMGGLIGVFLQKNFYEILDYNSLILYNFCNAYIYIYMLKIEYILKDIKCNTNFILFLIFLNIIILILNKNKINNIRGFLFLSS